MNLVQINPNGYTVATVPVAVNHTLPWSPRCINIIVCVKYIFRINHFKVQSSYKAVDFTIS